MAPSPKFTISAYAEKAVYEYVKTNPNCKSKEVADALYDTVCRNGQTGAKFKRPPKIIRNEWASKLLQNLKKKQLVYFSHTNLPRWCVK